MTALRKWLARCVFRSLPYKRLRDMDYAELEEWGLFDVKRNQFGEWVLVVGDGARHA